MMPLVSMAIIVILCVCISVHSSDDNIPLANPRV